MISSGSNCFSTISNCKTDQLNNRHTAVRAFTLIELMVSVAIFLIMTTIMLADYPDTLKKINLANLASTISLIVREAQIRGSAIDSKGLNVVSGYGVYFDLNNTSKVTFFNDFPNVGTVNGIPVGNGIYETSPSEANSFINLPKDFKVYKICTNSVATGIVCGNVSDTSTINSLTVSFIRPSPKALIFENNDLTKLRDDGCVEIHSPRAPNPGHVRSVRVYGSGRIITSYTGCS